MGGNGNPKDGKPTVIRYDGSKWSNVTVPDLKHDGVHALFKVWGTASDNVYMVGQNGTILHWNGSKLVDETPDTDKDLISLWGTGEDNILVVGGRGNGVLARWDGESWSTHSLAPLLGMNGIWVRDRKHAWITGARGTIAHVDPTADTIEPTVERVDTRRDFHAIFGLAGDGLFAVGGNLNMPSGPFHGIAYRGRETE